MSIADWWFKLPESARGALVEDPERDLTADLVIAITHAAGVGPTLTQWEGQPPVPAHLTPEQVEWIRTHGATDSL